MANDAGGHALDPGLPEVVDVEGHDVSHPSIVVGFDRHGESHDALDVGIGFAARLGAHVHVVHARNVDDYPIDPDAADWESQAAENLVEERLAAVEALRNHAYGWTYHAARGDPANALISVADEHDALMIVVGSRGEGWRLRVERLIEPAVSHRLIEHAHRPVLVVSHPLLRAEG